MKIRLLVPLLLVLALGLYLWWREEDTTWRAGVARARITPEEAIWMSGYASRTAPAQGTLIDLWAKVLALEDRQGQRLVLITLDLIGIDRATSQAIRDEIARRYGLGPECIAIGTSHTHTGPVVGRNLATMFDLPEEQWRKIDRYTEQLRSKIVDLVGQALVAPREVEISWAQGQATFAVNRRNNPEAEVTSLRESGQLKGPTDHDVPVLRVQAGKDLLAVVFGYACHATVLDINQWSGDYPGYAQRELEATHPGAQAMFLAGCGADQNPLPRRQIPLAEQYGMDLAKAVDEALAKPMRRIGSQARADYRELDLPLAALPTREALEKSLASEDIYEKRWASSLLSGGPMKGSYPYPLQAWRLGQDFHWIMLGGEVVVDYSLRLKENLGREKCWISAYANDVMAYIPSERVLMEGGYEGGGAMRYYGLPSPWATGVENRILDAALNLVRR